MSMDVHNSMREGTCLVYVSGEVDVSNADDLRGALNDALGQGCQRVEVDLGDVSYIDSTGIGVLVGAARRAAEASQEFIVSHPQHNVARVLMLLGVSDELGVSQ